MKAVLDNKIPYIKGQIERLVDDTVYLPGSMIDNNSIKDADILIIRTRTQCDRSLLEGTKVKLIVTATIGFDHIDTTYCKQSGIQWANCPGCNANSVCIYVHNALIATGKLRPSLTIGIIGVGHVGSLILHDAEHHGMNVLLSDPPREDTGDLIKGHSFTTLQAIQEKADIITFHTPLTTSGKYPTYHLADYQFFHQLKRHPLIINASRGGVVDNEALYEALTDGIVSDAVIDTWEHEPHINTKLLQRVAIGTPHVAGYSADGKANATRMTLEVIANYLAIPFTADIQIPQGEKMSVETLMKDSTNLKKSPELFEDFRSNYPIRRE